MRSKLNFSVCTRGRSPPFAFCGGCYENRRGRSTNPGHSYSSLTARKLLTYDWSIMKRSASQAPQARGKWSCPDPPFLKMYPTLAEGMCDCWWDDGKPRTPWSLTIRFEGDQTHLCVNDKEGSMGLYTTAETLSGALGQLEALLKGGGAAWRRWKK